MADKKNPALMVIIVACLLAAAILSNRCFRSRQEETADIFPLVSTGIKQEVEAKWGKPYMELSTEHLVIISPHNEAIRGRFENAFVEQYALKNGKRVLIWWHQLAGSNAILDFLLGEKAQERPLPLDVVFGGGEYLFEQLADKDMLTPLALDEDVLAQIPQEFAGVRLYDAQQRWCGNVLSGFGFLYDKSSVRALGLTDLAAWQDLARPELSGKLAIADPGNSGSTVAAFEMIVQSEPDWPTGWRKLLSILANAKEFATSSDDAANAPQFGQATAAICIDFYGISRQAVEPGKLAYVSPQGQTAFTPDPIGVLAEAPNADVAHEFVTFVLSSRGQSLWGKKCFQADAVSVNALYRTPIRKDFYATPSTDIPASVRNPYELGQAVHVDSELRLRRFGVLRQLARAAAVANFDHMVQAVEKLNAADAQASLAEVFFKLPDNVDTVDKVKRISQTMKDPRSAQQIYDEWVQFFQQQYRDVLASS